MKLNINKLLVLLGCKYIIFNNTNKSIVFFIISNYFNCKIKDINEINNLSSKFTLFNKINNLDYAINIDKDNSYIINLDNKIKPKLILVNEELIKNIKIDNYIIFDQIFKYSYISDFLNDFFIQKYNKKIKTVKYNFYQIMNLNDMQFIKILLQLDVNLRGNFLYIKKFKYYNRFNKFISLEI
ncbi:hypothetical protein IOLA_309 [uncultured bacterium]|nr:hypothetical protein IOLA_309 [uncultured bacterium]